MHKGKYVLGIILLVGIILAVMMAVSKEGLTGATVIKSVSCYDGDDCIDDNPETDDWCQNPGTEESLCVNSPIKK